MDILLILVILIIPAIAQIGIKTNYNKYLKVANKKGLSGQEVARKILDKNGLSKVYVVETEGLLSDHYDPRRKTVRLSKAVFEGESISSLSIAAHECGHAIQDKVGYTFLRIRSLIFPIVNIATSVSYYIILIGFVLQILNLVYIGVGFTLLGLLFQIITLPVEFNASKRAKEELNKLGLVDKKEAEGVKKMLHSAAMTYVAGVLASATQIIRLLLIANRRN